jgi:hypothetical protein
MEAIMKLLVVSLTVLLALSACADIQHTASPEQALDRTLLAGPGDVVLRINRQRNLENALGKSDVFGRKTNEGFIEIRFAGVESNGQLVLSRKDVQIITNETTMSRTPVTQTSGRANTALSARAADDFGGTTVNAAATTTYQETTITPSSDFHVVVPADTIPIRIAATDSVLPVEGYIIEIIRATPHSLEYRIRRQ